MRILIACEYSATVRDAFRRLGHDAWSCDLLPTMGDPSFHYQQDVLELLGEGWDMMIAHPPCTYLTCSAEWAYKDPDFIRYPGIGYHQKLKEGTLFGAARRKAREEAATFVQKLWSAPIKKRVIENPIGVLKAYIGKPSQIIQPYEFGEDASKATCLWIDGLPLLKGMDRVKGRLVVQSGKMVERWSNQTDSGQNKMSPSADRWARRSDTFPKIAQSMADQWGTI